MPELRHLPRFEMPVAYLRFWDESSEGGGHLIESVECLPAIPGVTRLAVNLLALRPIPGRSEVVDIAVRLADVLQRRAAKTSHSTVDSLPGILLFPGRAMVDGDQVRAMPDVLFDDLEHKPARLPAGRVVLTGYAAAWLSGRYEVTGLGAFEGPSGRRVPLFAIESERHPGEPWHNPALFGRRIEVPRQRLDDQIEAAMASPSIGLEGPLGVGKSRAVWQALGQRPAIWTGLHRGLPNLPQLTRTLTWQLHELAPEPAAEAGVSPSALDRLAPKAAAERLIRRLEAAAQLLGTRPIAVIEGPGTAHEEDREVLEALVMQLADGHGQGAGCRLILIDRVLPRTIRRLDLPTVRVPAFDEHQVAELTDKLLAGLEIPPAVVDRLVTASAGHPLAMEEGLVALVHRGLLRRVYGSFFYAGGDDGDYRPSWQLTRHVEAAASAAGEALPLRTLAAAEEPIDPAHLRSTCAEFGVDLAANWHREWIEASWLEEREGCLHFACPAYGLALGATLGRDGIRTLRHALGGVLAGGGAEWTAYRLMAGSPEALPSLLDTSRDGTETPREEVFNALWTEHREHRERAGDESTELEILWALLPLARRLGCLGRLHRELSRAIRLARGHEQRYVALVALKAEHDQEQGNFRDAEAGLREALTASEGFDEKRRATLFMRLGALLHRQQRWAEARDVFLGLASVADRGGETALGATCRFYLGNLALQQRRLDSAEAHQRQSLEYRRKNQLHKAAGTSLCALGAISLARGDYPQALDHFDEAERTLTQAGAEPWEVSFAVLGIGRARIRLGDYPGGTAQLRKALEQRKGRDDVIGEAIALLELAAGHLFLEQNDKAAEQAHRAHFQLSLAPEGAFLGDAELLLGRIAMRHGESETAVRHFGQAVRLHRRYADDHALAEDCSWQLELALRSDDDRGIEQSVLELERLLDTLPQPDGGEALFYRLYRGLTWLRHNGQDLGDPEKPLRRAYKELMRKTGFLPAARRQPFLFQVRIHQDILNAATEYQISLPYVPQVVPPPD